MTLSQERLDEIRKRAEEEVGSMYEDADKMELIAEVERLRNGLSYLTDGSQSFDSPDQMAEVAQTYLDGKEDE